MHGYGDDQFQNRAEIAKYLGVSRMQLYRYEKILVLPTGRWAIHASRLKKKDVDKWKQDLHKAAMKKSICIYI